MTPVTAESHPNLWAAYDAWRSTLPEGIETKLEHGPRPMDPQGARGWGWFPLDEEQNAKWRQVGLTVIGPGGIYRVVELAYNSDGGMTAVFERIAPKPDHGQLFLPVDPRDRPILAYFWRGWHAAHVDKCGCDVTLWVNATEPTHFGVCLDDGVPGPDRHRWWYPVIAQSEVEAVVWVAHRVLRNGHFLARLTWLQDGRDDCPAELPMTPDYYLSRGLRAEMVDVSGRQMLAVENSFIS